MIQRWKAITKMPQYNLFEQINDSRIHRSFEFLAHITSILNVLKPDEVKDLLIR
jgi:hypothetical protein